MKKLILEERTNSKKSLHALAGANLRKELKHRYPNTKFKVTTDSYTGGSSLRVKYLDGARLEDIQAIVSKYVYGHFNGMDDMYEYDKDSTDKYGEVKYAFVDRSYSKEKFEEAIKEEAANVEINFSEYSGYSITGDYDDERRVYENLRDKDFYGQPIQF
jgi:hypothetical protein